MGVLKQWLPYVLSGISAGGQYALIAVGYTMVYGILRLINFAHGDIFMVAGLIMVYLSASMPMYVCIPAVVVLTVALGFAIERCAYKPLRQAPRMSVMISAIGVSYLLQNLAYYVTGGVPAERCPYAFPESFRFGGHHFPGFLVAVSDRVISARPRVVEGGLVRAEVHFDVFCRKSFPEVNHIALIGEGDGLLIPGRDVRRTDGTIPC